VYQYYLTDAVGSVVALTDQNGVVQTQYSYGPFGATASTGAASDNPYQFAGRELDPNGGFGIYYFRARYYDSLELNRFLERDPNGLSGGNYATLYAYVGNSPLNGTDPTGQFGIFGFSGPNPSWDGFAALEDGIAVDAGIAGATADQLSLIQASAANNVSAQGGAQGNGSDGLSPSGRAAANTVIGQSTPDIIELVLEEEGSPMAAGVEVINEVLLEHDASAKGLTQSIGVALTVAGVKQILGGSAVVPGAEAGGGAFGFGGAVVGGAATTFGLSLMFSGCNSPRLNAPTAAP
jgi:RHS repeat-associated protein